MYLLITLMVVSGLSVSEFIVMKQHLGCSFVNRAKICLEFATCLLELCQKKKGMAAGSVIITVGFLRFPQEWDILLFIYITVNKRELEERMDFLLIHRPRFIWGRATIS